MSNYMLSLEYVRVCAPMFITRDSSLPEDSFAFFTLLKAILPGDLVQRSFFITRFQRRMTVTGVPGLLWIFVRFLYYDTSISVADGIPNLPVALFASFCADYVR